GHSAVLGRRKITGKSPRRFDRLSALGASGAGLSLETSLAPKPGRGWSSGVRPRRQSQGPPSAANRVRQHDGFRLENVQVVIGDKAAAINGTHLAHQVLLGRFCELIALMIEDEKAWKRSRRQFTQLARPRVIRAPHPLPFWR